MKFSVSCLFLFSFLTSCMCLFFFFSSNLTSTTSLHYLTHLVVFRLLRKQIWQNSNHASRGIWNEKLLFHAMTRPLSAPFKRYACASMCWLVMLVSHYTSLLYDSVVLLGSLSVPQALAWNMWILGSLYWGPNLYHFSCCCAYYLTISEKRRAILSRKPCSCASSVLTSIRKSKSPIPKFMLTLWIMCCKLSSCIFRTLPHESHRTFAIAYYLVSLISWRRSVFVLPLCSVFIDHSSLFDRPTFQVMLNSLELMMLIWLRTLRHVSAWCETFVLVGTPWYLSF